ncbi:MAG: hypothetical protein WAQ99_22485 [Pyrinomonadaceae bacterium]
MDYLQAAVNVIRKQGISITPIRIEVDSNLPPRAGLASSAAVTVAAVGALAQFYRLDLPVDRICQLAYLVESSELLTGAGQMDFYVTGLGGFLYIDSFKTPPDCIEPFRFPPSLGIVISNTGKPRATSDVIRAKRARMAAGEPGILSYVAGTEKAIQRMRIVLARDNIDTKEFGELVTSCHTYLDAYMRVSTDLLNACVSACIRNGAVGAKLTGTGLGGCMFAIVPKFAIPLILRSLSTYSVDVHVTEISRRGLETHER